MNKFLTKKNIIYVIFSLVIFSFFYGFYFDENSAGSGGYNGDITWILTNIEIFKNNSLKEAILHNDFFGNRTPLIYILNSFLNPFMFEYEKYRISIFILSFMGPIFIYLCLKKRFPEINKEIILLLSSVILLSPYYRTSAYWALNENYGLITSLISLFFLNLFIEKNISIIQKYFYLFSIIFFSSLSVYFDLKLLIVTIICFFYIMKSKILFKEKFLSLLLYLTFGIPYLLLILEWNGIVAPKTQAANPNTITNISRINDLYVYHLGYVSTIIGFYLFPFLFFKKKNFFQLLNDFLNNKAKLALLILPLIYIFYMYSNIDFKSFTIDDYWVGLGIVKKIADLFFQDILFREAFTYLMFFLSWAVIILYVDFLSDYLILSFYFILSLIIWPLMQEYFDPIIIILVLMILKTKIKLNYLNSSFLFFYFATLLIIAKVYYSSLV
tara:strand:+ start:122 stop:1444 length:1323 start_codon:yes stop_codon:yes gene_type:complete